MTDAKYGVAQVPKDMRGVRSLRHCGVGPAAVVPTDG